MTGRDRIVLMVVGVLAVLAAAYVLVVSPEKHRAAQVNAQAQAARSELSAARTKLAEAQQDQKRYSEAYASIVSLGQAVPAEQEVSSLVYELDHASSKDKVGFESITAGGSGGSSSSATAAAATAATGGFRQMPFTFSFQGTFEELYKLMGRLQAFTVSNPDGSVKVDGRLLSIQGVTLQSSSPSGSASGGGGLTATVTATAYVLPAGQTLAGGAGSAAPAGATPAGSGATGSSAATPAIVRPLP